MKAPTVEIPLWVTKTFGYIDEFVYGKIGLSTVSTYFARMSHENILIRRGNRNQREYRFKDENNTIHKMEYGLVK